MSDPFQPRAPGDVAALIEAHPLAWIVSRLGDGLRGTTLPLMARTDAQGAVVELEGHFPRANPQVAELRRDPRVLIMFSGPQGYVSPSWISDRTWAPTWNFAHVQFEAELEFFEASEAIAAHLRELVDFMERGRSNAWSVDEMGPRFDRLAQAVIGFRARVTRTEARFKLGQDERPEVFGQILQHAEPAALRELMASIGGPSKER